MIRPPTTNASAAPSVPAFSSQPPTSTTQPKPIIAPNPTARVSQRPSALIRPTSLLLVMIRLLPQEEEPMITPRGPADQTRRARSRTSAGRRHAPRPGKAVDPDLGQPGR